MRAKVETGVTRLRLVGRAGWPELLKQFDLLADVPFPRERLAVRVGAWLSELFVDLRRDAVALVVVRPPAKDGTAEVRATAVVSPAVPKCVMPDLLERLTRAAVARFGSAVSVKLD